jgi:hypothetical protein
MMRICSLNYTGKTYFFGTGKCILNVLQYRKDGMARLTAGTWKLRGIQTGIDKENCPLS